MEVNYDQRWESSIGDRGWPFFFTVFSQRSGKEKRSKDQEAYGIWFLTTFSCYP